MHRLIKSHVGLTAVFRDIEQHTTGNEPGAPMIHAPKSGSVKSNFLVRVAAVPHALVVPRVTQRVEMCRGDAVIIEAHVVRREAAGTARDDLHPVVGWIGVTWTGQFWKVTAKRDATTRSNERGRLDALRRGDQVNGADLVVLAPTPPITPLMEIGEHFLTCRYAPFCHVVLLVELSLLVACAKAQTPSLSSSERG